MKAKKEVRQILKWIDQVKETDCSFKEIFKSNFLEKDKVMFSTYEGEARHDFTYGTIEKAIYTASEAILEKTGGHYLGSFIAINAENKIIWVIAFWATLIAGYKAFLLNPSHLEETNVSALKTLGVQYIVGDTAFKNYPFVPLEIKESDKVLSLDNFANEIALSSSGSSSTPKVAVYSGKKVFENIVNYGYVINKDHNFISHKGLQHSQLVILPFYHIFGFMLVFMWYSFSHSRFVLPKDLTAQSISPILQKDQINMILAVPLFFELVYEKVLNTAKKQGKEKKLLKLLAFNNKIQTIFPHLGTWIVRHITAKGLRKKTFGKYATILGIGGAKISHGVLETLNGLGYRATNGYGTTELSIFLAAYGCSVKALNTATIGNDPWRGKYRYAKDGSLSLKLPTTCDYVLENGKKHILNPDEFIPTGDIGHENNGYLYIDAREDDLLVLPNGEKVYPNLIEAYFEFLGVNRYRILNYQNKIVLIVYQDQNTSKEDLYHLYVKIKEANKNIPSAFRVKEIRKTNEPLPLSIKQEVSRLALANLLHLHPENYPFITANEEKINKPSFIEPKKLLYIKMEVANILHIDNVELISDDDDFFADLGGDSISFMELTSRLNEKGTFAGDKALAMSTTSIKEIAIQYKMDII